ncbi:D-lactate dehydrogenase [Helicobacter pylori NCTC 11637 = CCUG 17874 = ATCC 43504 = JCM 12093]|nr:D-lactate dehydrogenase [Helicobacter pylori NCTC 11637 = CCUG 17874 = ATCC 43504 = JCM 12093]
MEENYHAFFTEASGFLNERIFKDYLRRLAYGIDASCYRYVPKIVAWVKDEEEVQKLCVLAKKHGVTLTFRAAGSSLSG